MPRTYKIHATHRRQNKPAWRGGNASCGSACVWYNTDGIVNGPLVRHSIGGPILPLEHFTIIPKKYRCGSCWNLMGTQALQKDVKKSAETWVITVEIMLTK